MKLRFLGAAGTVTGSRFLIQHGTSKVLVDCGLFQGFKQLRLKNREPFPVPVDELNSVILSHSHLDHSGYIPLLVKNGFRGPVYATAAAIDLCRILLPDSGFLQEEEARLANKRNYSKHHPALPLYTVEDAERSLESFCAVEWHETKMLVPAGKDPLSFELRRSGHLLGAASVVIRAAGRSIIFSGDLGRKNDPMIIEPDPLPRADYLIIESTYGNRQHPDSDPEEELRQIALRTLNRKGILLIPAFAVGRAQLILFYLERLKQRGAIPREVPIYLNSPMAINANDAFQRHASELRISGAELKRAWENVHTISTPEESIALNNRTEPAIILAASGMATGGRVLHHLKKLAPDPKNTIVFAGYQAGGTRGAAIVEGAKKIKIHGEYWPIRAEVVSLETLSAHADADGILNWIRASETRPMRVFVAHGEPAAADVLRHRIEEEIGIPALVPELGQEIELV